MSKKITFGLSSSEVKQSIKEIKKYQSELNIKCQKFAEKLAEHGVKIAKMKITQYDAIYTSQLLNSINSEKGSVVQPGGKWIIYTACEGAAFVEFGSWVEGKQSPHPDTSLVGWKYDVGNHGEKGWFYFLDGEWHWTKGMPSRPFMFETGKELRELIVKVAREVFNHD